MLKQLVVAVRMMAETCYLAESSICYPPLFNELRSLTSRPTDTTETVAMAAVAASHEQGASAIMVMSTSGNTARLVSKYRPECPIICRKLHLRVCCGLLLTSHDSTVTRNASTSRSCHLHRGVYPILYDAQPPKSDQEWQRDVDNRLLFGMTQGIELGILPKEATVVAIQGWRSGGKHTNTLVGPSLLSVTRSSANHRFPSRSVCSPPTSSAAAGKYRPTPRGHSTFSLVSCQQIDSTGRAETESYSISRKHKRIAIWEISFG